MMVLFGVFGHLMLALLHFAMVALDIGLLCLVVKWLAHRCPTVLPFAKWEAVGSRVIDPLVSMMKQGRRVSSAECLLWLSILLSVTRILLTAAANLVIVQSYGT